MFVSSPSNNHFVNVGNLNASGRGQSIINNRIFNNTIIQVASSTANAPNTSNTQHKRDFSVPIDSNQWLIDAILDRERIEDGTAVETTDFTAGRFGEAEWNEAALAANDETTDFTSGRFREAEWDEAALAAEIMKQWHARNEGLNEPETAILNRHGYLNGQGFMTWKALKALGVEIPGGNSQPNLR